MAESAGLSGPALERAYREEWSAVVATLARRLGDLQAAEDAAAEAFATRYHADWSDEPHTDEGLIRMMTQENMIGPEFLGCPLKKALAGLTSGSFNRKLTGPVPNLLLENRHSQASGQTAD